ncbi:hypothetical protein HMPREF3218_0200251 [Prevotella bivia]|nr:hypothetical protein HMPREF3218_0200251 [Prevotella bivia]
MRLAMHSNKLVTFFMTKDKRLRTTNDGKNPICNDSYIKM